VTIGTRDAGFTEIKKGLSASDLVMVNRTTDPQRKGDKP
jgi:hypothetical protein